MIPQDCVRVHLNFTTTNEEIAVSTFMVQLNHEGGAPTNWPEMTQDLATKVYDSWSNQVGGGNNRDLFPPNVVLRDVSTYHLDANTGHAIDKGLHPGGAQSWAGTGGSPSLPLECSVAVSLFGYTPGSFIAQRARHRGRMYLPPMTAQVLDGGVPRQGRLAPAAWTQITQAMGGFFNDMQNKSVGSDPLDIGQTWELVVLSRAGGFTTPVQTVRVGDVIDVQRRRRNKQEEVYKDVQITRSGGGNGG